MTTEYAQRRVAGEDAITKPSERTVRARASLPADKDTKIEIPAPWTRTARDMFIYRAIERPMTCREIADATGLEYKAVYQSLRDMLEEGRVMVNDGKMYTVVPSNGWPDKVLQAVAYIPSKGAGKGRRAVPRERVDILAPMVGDKTIAHRSLPTYRRAYEDISRLPHYGIGELDESIKAFKDILRARLDSVEYDCPTCGKAIEVTARTACRCKRCGWSIDVGSVEGALALAKAIPPKDGPEREGE